MKNEPGRFRSGDGRPLPPGPLRCRAKKIAELLAESLLMQDRQEELLNKLTGVVSGQTGILNRMVKSVDDLTEVVRYAVKKLDKIDEHEQRLARIEKHLFK